jgi:hypothetical protein
MHYHKKEIRIITQDGRYNLFAPFDRGGLGFMPPPGLKFRFTNIQRRWATCLQKFIEDDPGMSLRIALIQRSKKPPTVSYYRERHWRLAPNIGPLDQEGRFALDLLPEHRDTTVPLPPLSEQWIEVEKPELMVRHPSKEALRRFRAEPWNKMSDADMLVFPWKVYEMCHIHVNGSSTSHDVITPKLQSAVLSPEFLGDGMPTDCTDADTSVSCETQSA